MRMDRFNPSHPDLPPAIWAVSVCLTISGIGLPLNTEVPQEVATWETLHVRTTNLQIANTNAAIIWLHAKFGPPPLVNRDSDDSSNDEKSSLNSKGKEPLTADRKIQQPTREADDSSNNKRDAQTSKRGDNQTDVIRNASTTETCSQLCDEDGHPLLDEYGNFGYNRYEYLAGDEFLNPWIHKGTGDSSDQDEQATVDRHGNIHIHRHPRHPRNDAPLLHPETQQRTKARRREAREIVFDTLPLLALQGGFFDRTATSRDGMRKFRVRVRPAPPESQLIEGTEPQLAEMQQEQRYEDGAEQSPAGDFGPAHETRLREYVESWLGGVISPERELWY